jgi:hypothetical protein
MVISAFNKIMGCILGRGFGSKNLILMGSPYGKKPLKSIESGITHLISGGVGEDISFEVELYNTNKMIIIFVDPTDKAEDHFGEFLQNLGRGKALPYSENGKQDTQSYDLSKLDRKNLHYIKKALFNLENRLLKMYPPLNPEHVSFSIISPNKNVEYLNNFIEFETITINEIVKNFNLQSNQTILKLDIESSEMQVIGSMFESKFFPAQIIVEIDELYINFFKYYFKAYKLVSLMKKNKYKYVGNGHTFDLCFERIS